MGHWAIVAEGLSKRYRISEGKRANSLTNALHDAFGWFEGRRSAEAGEFWALRDVSFQVDVGKRLGIVGPNGAGKSTLLKILSRITAPTEGVGRLRGRIASLLEVGTGFHPELSGRENVYLNGAVLGMTRADIGRAFDSIVDFAGVEKFIDTPIKHYSSGMHARLAFAVAAQLEPDILIVDEVLSVGDAAFQKKCQKKIDSAAKEGRTILLVSHSMASVRKLCDQAILLDHGVVKSTGATNEVVEEYMAESEAFEISEVASQEYPDNPKKPAVIRRVAIVDKDGSPSRNFGLDSVISVEIDVVLKEQLQEVVIIAAVSREGIYLFQTHDSDLDESLLGARQPGYYRATFSLPRRLLTAGVYSVTAKVAVGTYSAFGEDGAPDAVSFVMDESDQVGNLIMKGWSKARANLVIVEPHWSVARLK